MGFRFKKEYEEYMWQKRSQGTCKPQKITPHPTDESELTEPLNLTAEPQACPLTATLSALRREQEHVQHLIQHALHHKRWHVVSPLQRLGSALAQAIHRCNEAAQEMTNNG